MMKRLGPAFQNLAGWQKAVVLLMIALILVTWLAVCAILSTYLA